MQIIPKELEAEKTARKRAEKKVSELEEQVSRVIQSTTDSKAEAGDVKENFRRQLAESQESVERWKNRACTAENFFKTRSKQAEEEKKLRAEAEQNAGDLTDMLEAVQQGLRDEAEAKAKKVDTHTGACTDAAATQTCDY